MSLRPRRQKAGSKRTPGKYGIHKRKFNGKLFRSYGIGGFFTSKPAAEKFAKAEREWGVFMAKVAKVEGGYRVFLRDKEEG